MTETLRPSRELTRTECLAFLHGADVGRLVFTQGALPAVLPVSYVLDGERVVLRTAAHGSIASSVDGAVVALQADALDPARRAGWTVTVIGEARLVHDPVEAARLAELPLVPWVAGERDVHVVLPVGLVTGRRLGGAEPVHAA